MKQQRLGERYRLIDRIGEGGMAFVYLALDEKLGRKVAIKVLHSHMEKNPDIRKRFQLEAQAISSLDHPNIVKIYDFSGDQSEKLWIVTEVISGQNLADYLQDQTNGILHPIIGTCIVREVLKALSKAHEQKIVHRDIKPENVMLTKDGRIKLMDFGIAKDMQQTGMTMTGTFMGSPSYMSPEQIRGKDVDFKSDIYSSSVLFYEIVTGKLPFVGSTTHEVVLKIIDGIYTFPRFIVPEITPEVDQQIIKGMSMDPSQRQDSVNQYGAALDTLLKKHGFDESHVELERYTKNPSDFFQAHHLQTKKTELLTQREPPSSQDQRKRRRGDLATAKSKNGSQIAPLSKSSIHRETGDLDKTEALGEPRFFVPRAPTARTKPVVTREQREQRAAPQQNHSVIKPPSFQEKLTVQLPPHHTVKAPQGPAKYQPPPADDEAKPVLETPQFTRQNPVAPQPPLPVFRPQRPARPPAWVQPPTNQTPYLLSYFFGFLWVGLILTLSVWGFLELNKYLNTHQRKFAGIQSGPDHKKTRPTRERPAPGPAISPKPPKQPETKYPEKSPEKIAEKVKIPPKTPPLRANRVIRNLPSQEVGALTVEGATIKQKKIKSVSFNKKPTAAPLSQPLAKEPLKDPLAKDPTKESPPEPKEPKTQGSGKARVQVSSQPAAEILIDGIKIGTTVDSTTNSGWIVVTSGTHQLELRRSGYVTHRTDFEVGDDAQLAIPKVDLKPEPQTTRPEIPRENDAKKGIVNLTVKVSHSPSTISIRNLETNGLQTTQIQSNQKTFVLESSRYLVRVEYAGQFKERTFNTSQSPGNLTFFVDF